MSLTKKDPSFCVAANDPHLVSLGGGRLSTAVTIHNIPIGDTTIGSSTRCSISLNGTGIRPLHCTIYRSEENEVTLVPERDARILIDGHKIDDEVNLTQGAMITVGKSYYLRFNNPAEAQQIRTAMGSNERISMPQIDFAPERQRHSSKSCNSTGTSSSGEVSTYQIDSFYETTIQTSIRQEESTDNNYVKATVNAYNNLAPIDINGLQCPKVFTADLVTVNMPAKDVLGQKYTKFAKNLADNHRNEKNLNNAWHNNQNQMNNSRTNGNIYDNVPPPKVNNQDTNCRNSEYLTKLKHANEGNRQAVTAYDRYPKLGNMQIFPMTTVNNEINTQTSSKIQMQTSYHSHDNKEHNGNISLDEKEHLDDMLKICSEYTDRQNQNSSNCGSMSSSPIVQNRIKTNGSLPRDKKSPFQHDLSTGSQIQQSFEGSFNNLSINNSDMTTNSSYSTGYENVRIVGQNRVELNGQLVSSPKSGYENVVIGKYVPQSPRTKIRTNCMSPKKEQSFASIFSQQKAEPQVLNNSNTKSSKQQEYDDLLKTFGEKLQQEMQNIEECSQYQPPKPTTYTSPHHRSNKNINNLKLNLKPPSSLQNSPKPNKKPAPAPRTLLKSGIRAAGGSLPHLAGVSPTSNVVDEKEQLKKSELDSLILSKQELENILDMLQDKIHRLEAQRNATRVMEENQQAKLKQSIEMKMDQINKLKDMLKQKPNNECLKEELKNISESLDNDRKQFEDLEFQYLEEESEWHAYHEELKTEEKMLQQQIEDKEKEMKNLQSPRNTTAATQNNNNNKASETPNSANSKTKTLNSSTLQNSLLNKPYDIGEAIGIMSQSLFGSAEILCPKRNNDIDIMSKSVNENMFFNNKIEFGSSSTANSSTPKRAQLQLVNIDDSQLTASYKQENISKSCESFTQAVRFNLSLGSDDFEVNPLEKRIPSQDDIDRISKVTTDNPISSQGATTKIFDSIKEIERNRQLLLAQQGHHVIEHERQKMNDLKKKIHSEARAQYISMFNRNSTDGTQSESQSSTQRSAQKQQQQQQQQKQQEHPLMDKENQPNAEQLLLVSTKNSQNSSSKHDDESLGQQRHSQPEFETTQRHFDDQQKRHSATSRPLSEANSDNGPEPLALQNASKSNMELSTSTAYALEKRLSSNSNDGGHSLLGSQKLRNKDGSDANERKRVLPKHQRPLTRYLPIFSPDLDLRQHIESAGHQIALCPHVFVDANSCRGYLHKLGATFHGWSKRWFVLDRQRNAFIYYSDKLERKPRGGAYFSTIDEVYLDHLNVSKSGRPHCTFIVKTKKRSYQLQAASDAAARIWIDAIITGAQGNLDY
ncbi:pleckstrin homology-like domain family B member 1 [Calliphora vicina]|uniref:pleckstrin homology-like domain family B member 1 n=1 Tax=Calliphora vicina TaxID=7373 RepID=UPI00325B14F2